VRDFSRGTEEKVVLVEGIEPTRPCGHRILRIVNALDYAVHRRYAAISAGTAREIAAKIDR
jgi:hypothetical protein